MSFLAINGCDVPVQDGQASLKPDQIGAGITRGASGAARNNYQLERQHLTGKTIVMPAMDARFLYALLRGEFDRVQPLDDTFATDKSLVPSVATNATYVEAGGRFSEGDILLGATTGLVTWAGIGSVALGLTVFLTRYDGAYHNWEIALAPGGALAGVWMDGVAQPTVLPAWITVGANLTIRNTTGSTVSYSEIFVVNAQESGTYAAAISDFLNDSLPPIAPALRCEGDFYPSALEMFGQPSSTGYVTSNLGGGPAANLDLAFDLIEA